MEAHVNVRLAVEESSQVGAARRAALELAVAAGLDEAARSNLAVVVTEAAGNLVKHARGGCVLLRALEPQHDARRGVEMLCFDRGPGIANVAASLRDGYSTAGTMGGGLGAIQRMADEFDLHSAPGHGTALMARFLAPRSGQNGADALEVGAVSVPRRGEEVCGDGWAVDLAVERTTLLVVDGLGHGIGAAEASRAAVRSFRAVSGRDVERQIGELDLALRHTRGAAAAVARVEPGGAVRYCGAGNTSGSVYGPDSHVHMVSQPGTLGHVAPRPRAFDYRVGRGALIVMHTDGISARWSLDAYPGLAQRHPSLIAAVLYRDFARESDDATVLVARMCG